MRRHLIYYALQIVLWVSHKLQEFVLRMAQTYLVPEEEEDATFQLIDSSMWDKAAESDSATISVREISLGDLRMPCPACGMASGNITVGISLHQDEEAVEGSVADINTTGVVIYECGTVFMSNCLTDKVATILNAAENDELTPQMFSSLSRCEVHGTDYSAE